MPVAESTPNLRDFTRLLFRRQFLLAAEPFQPNEYWTVTELQNGLHLSVHADLPVNVKSEKGISLALLGVVIDPFFPERSEAETLQLLFEEADNCESLLTATKHFAGRWVVIYQQQGKTIIFTDPCGLRQVFYHIAEKNVRCASQPELIKQVQPLETDIPADMRDYITAPFFAAHESPAIGPKTMYRDCLHLMPNHYFDLNEKKQIRWYPLQPVVQKETPQVVEEASRILQGIMTGLVKRFPVVMALTAGWDSRVLLAASRSVSRNLHYFMFQPSAMPDHHPDVWVPRKISADLNLNFSAEAVPAVLPGWFVHLLANNVTDARVLPKTMNIYAKLLYSNCININGNASEICRIPCGLFDMDEEQLTSGLIAKRFFGSETKLSFVLHELDKWRKGISIPPEASPSLGDLLYWEQKMGNWGALYPAEQDIAVDEISPFNCRLLLETLLSAPPRLRTGSIIQLYQELIRNLWPELLNYPINPPLEKPSDKDNSFDLNTLKKRKTLTDRIKNFLHINFS